MKVTSLIPLALLVFPMSGDAQEVSPADSTAVFAAMERWEEAWRVKDVEMATQDYSDDADWTNAFGMRAIGQAAIHEVLTNVFDLPFVMAGDTEYEFHDLRSLGPDVMLLRSRAIRTGQQLPDGSVEEPRRTNHLRVFERRAGAWRIVSHLIGDERTPGQPR
jgi:uncharacterized protein (TIGR02246 family)